MGFAFSCCTRLYITFGSPEIPENTKVGVAIGCSNPNGIRFRIFIQTDIVDILKYVLRYKIKSVGISSDDLSSFITNNTYVESYNNISNTQFILYVNVILEYV